VLSEPGSGIAARRFAAPRVQNRDLAAISRLDRAKRETARGVTAAVAGMS
jgi:hypothetical protein